MKSNKYVKFSMVLGLNLLLTSIAYYILIESILKINYSESIPLLIIALIGFIAGSIYYVRKSL